jgi:hypothetical protein
MRQFQRHTVARFYLAPAAAVLRELADYAEERERLRAEIAERELATRHERDAARAEVDQLSTVLTQLHEQIGEVLDALELGHEG